MDDGSTDDTAAVAEAAGARVIRQVPNQGKGAALRAGFRLALDEGWDAVLTLDADGQHDPDEIPRFVAAFGGARGVRAAAGADHRPARLRPDAAGPAAVEHGRHRGVLVGRGPARAGQPVRVPAPRPAPDGRHPGQPETGFEFEVEMIAVCLRSGWTLAWVPISTIYAGEPSHVKPVAHLRHFVRATRAARRLMREGR